EAEYETFLSGIRRDLLKAVDVQIKNDPKGRESLPEEVQKILEQEREMSLNQCRTVSTKLALRNPGMGKRMEEAGIMEARLNEQRKKEVRILQEMEEMRPTFVAKRGDFLATGEEV